MGTTRKKATSSTGRSNGSSQPVTHRGSKDHSPASMASTSHTVNTRAGTASVASRRRGRRQTPAS